MVIVVCRRGDLREILTATDYNGRPRRHTTFGICSAGHTLQKTHSLDGPILDSQLVYQRPLPGLAGMT
jgi:hypothetical protein